MAQLAISAVGAAAGFIVGGPVGAQVGWAIGSLVGSQFGPKDKSYGPKLTDLRVTGVEYGQPIPWAAGHPRVAGQVWWSSDRREIATTTSAGKGGGAQSTSYTYESDVLFGLVDREIVGVARVWLNGKLVWTAHVDSDSGSIANSIEVPEWGRMTVYTGGSAQLPDPAYEAVVGVGNAPAYRGRGCVFIEGLQLGNSGVLPNLTFEVVIDGALTYTDKGFLSQWEVLTSPATVEAELGPDPVLSGSAVLQTSVKKWGAGALYVPNSSSAITPIGTPVQNEMDGKSWRFECWVYWIGSQDSAAISIKGVGGRGVGFGRPSSFTAYYGFANSSVAGISGVFGDGVDRPPLNTWVHVAIEQKYGEEIKLYDSAKGGFVTTFGSIIHVFTSSDMQGVRVELTFGGAFYVDSMLFRWFEADEEDELYTNGYSIPTGPFTPPPYAYTNIDPYDDTLRNVVETLCARAGMPSASIDASALDAITKPVRAFTLAQVGSTRAALEQLASAYFFEAYTTDKLYFVPRAGGVADAIDADDLAAGVDQAQDETLPTTVGSEAEIMAQVSLSYSNVDADYTIATEHSDRLLSGQISTGAVQVALAFTAAEAKGIADAMVVDGYASRVTGRLAVPLEYSALVPTDVVSVPDADGNVYRVRLVRRTDSGPLLDFEWVLDDPSAIESAGITSTDYTPTVGVALPGDTQLKLIDAPLLRDEDNTLGHYVAASSSGTTWPGASVNRSSDDVEFAEAARVSERAILGTATTALAAWTGGRVFDEVNTVTVDIIGGTLASSTRTAMLDDLSINAMMVGSELIRFRTATLGDPGVYTLSGLLRGQKGTEWAGATHTIGEQVVLMRTAGLRHVPIDVPSVGLVRYYKGVTLGRTLASATSQAFTSNGVILKPLAPVDLRKSVGSTAAISVTWKRRTRLSSTFTGPAGAQVPLGEAAESYSVDVVVASVVVRTFTASSASIAYTAPMQTADGVSGATAIRFDVYQVSATVGRGYVASLTATGAVSPQPQISTLTVGGTFATGAALYATLGGVTYGHTSVGGDTNLDGIATSLASVINAAPSYSAGAAGAVVTVTGPTSVPFSVVAGVTAGDNTLTWALTQTASAEVAGVGNELTFRWLNLGDPGGANAYPLGMTFYATVQRISPPLNLTYSYVTTPSGRTNYEVLPIAAAAILSAFTASGDRDAYGLSMNLSDAPTSTLSLITPAAEPYNWTVQAVTSQPGVSGLVGNRGNGVTPASLRPQVVTLTLGGTPVSGRTYRATLGGVDLDYTATGGDTTMALVATGLAGVIDAHASYIASAVGAVITITHASDNVPFTYSGQVIASTVTLTAATTQEAA